MADIDRIEKINNIPLCDEEARNILNELKELFDTLANKYHTHDNYITKTKVADLYATKEYVNSEYLDKKTKIDNIDLSIYVTKQELENKKYLTSIPNEYITESELKSKEFITQHEDLSKFATKNSTDNKIAELKQYVINKPFALKTYVAEIDAIVDDLEIDVADLKTKFADLRAEIDKIKNNQGIVNPEPEPIYYTITYNLSNNVTLSNNETTILENNKYEATLSIDSGYEINSIQIYMNSKDITGTVYQNNKISIPEVTGNVSISITTARTEIGPPSISVSGSKSGSNYYVTISVSSRVSVDITCSVSSDTGGDSQSASGITSTSLTLNAGTYPTDGSAFHYSYDVSYYYASTGESGTTSGYQLA